MTCVVASCLSISFYSDKSNNFESITLTENGNLLTDDFKFAETFNKYFQNLMPNLDLKVPSTLLCQTPENGDDVLAAIYKYQNHPSIKTIFGKCNFNFTFKTVFLTNIEKEIKNLTTKKSIPFIRHSYKNFKTNCRFLFSFYIRLR